MKTYLTIGLMSGTSMDGVDAAILETDGEAFVKSHGSIFLPYEPQFQREMKQCEQVVKQSLDESYDIFSERHMGWKEIIRPVIKKSTQLHIQAVKQLLQKFSLSSDDINVIGYHGQTLYHAPDKKLTLQIGDAKFLAEQCNIDVVYDFRQNDVNNGGQGAPFAPLYHQALVLRDNLTPCSILNCGGISNVTHIRKNEIIAFDIGPGNGLLDRFVKLKTNHEYQMDLNGVFSQQGQVQKAYLNILYEESCKNHFYEKSAPKSLDINDLQLPQKVMELSLEDGAATLVYFTALCIRDACTIPTSTWILAGGGWKNPSITQSLKHLLEEPSQIYHAHELGWDGDALEAEIFAYLAVRSLKSLPLSLPSTTGVSAPCLGGKLVQK